MRTKKPVPAHNLKTTRQGKVKRRSIVWRWRRLFYLAFLGFTVLVAGAAFVVSRVQLPVDPSVAPTERQTSFICSAEVQSMCNASNAMAQLHGAEDRSLVTYRQIPKVLREAVVSAEDREFFQHGGVDPVGIARAAVADIRGNGAEQGGSTITQQYVKNTYLNRERTVTRKIKEAVMAVKLEQKLSKQVILTRYLNTIYFGRGAYGVQAASRAWFNHDVGSLQLTEAAFLAGLIRAPQSADPFKGPKSLAEANRRRRVVLEAMVEEKYITRRQMRDAQAAKLRWPLITLPPTTADLGNVAGQEKGTKYFVDYVRRFLIRRFGESEVYGGGLKVYTTLDRTMQAAAYDAVTTTLDQPDDPAGALVAIDDKGQVKAMMGGRKFEESHVNLAVGKEGGGSGRQPGSTFKPFALAEAVREGYSVQSRFRSPSFIEIPDGQGRGQPPWRVRGGYGNGTATLVQATQHSVNTVYAQLGATLGMNKVIAMAHDLGVSKTADLPDQPSLVLGSGSVSVLDMASAYSTFADQGAHLSPIVVTRVERPDGSVVDFTPERTQVLAPDQAARITYCLQQVVQGGTGTAANFGIPEAGKTGTTTSNVDAWFAGYTPKLTAAVWMGYPTGSRSMDNVHGIAVQGGTLPAEMWRKFMEAATANTDPGTFPDPGDLSSGTQLNPDLSTYTTVPRSTPQATTPTSAGGTTSSSTPRSTPTSRSTSSTSSTTTTKPGPTTATTSTKPSTPTTRSTPTTPSTPTTSTSTPSTTPKKPPPRPPTPP